MRSPTIAALAVVPLARPARRAAEPQDNRMLPTCDDEAVAERSDRKGK